jgi:hypothetical protein
MEARLLTAPLSAVFLGFLSGFSIRAGRELEAVTSPKRTLAGTGNGSKG